MAATTTSHVVEPAALRSESTSQASATSHVDAAGSPGCSARAHDGRGRCSMISDLVAGCSTRSLGDERADVAAAGDGDPHQCCLSVLGRRWRSSSSSDRVVDDEVQHVALLADQVGVGDLRRAEAA